MTWEDYKKELLDSTDNGKETIRLTIRMLNNELTHEDKDRLIDLIYRDEPMLVAVEESDEWDSPCTKEYCSECEKRLTVRTFKYCPECGQKIKWEDS